MKRYNPKEIEPKWQKVWQEQGIYEAQESSSSPKRYVLEYFPYPSGAAMHVGHVRNYTIGDAISRFSRMRGHNVLHPMGWDAFGLPAENYAIKTGISPQQTIKDSTAKFKKQLVQMGFGYDWSREINSSDPSYYKWTQWLFLLLYKRGLVYQKESLQWWCPVDNTVLANEQVENGRCWRCDSEVEKKALPQWFFKITDYADRLLEDLDDLDWSDAIKSMQRNWIGKSIGAEIEFAVANSEARSKSQEASGQKVKVFTTRPDTLFGATFMVLAPEHPLVSQVTTAEQKSAVNAYVKEAQAKSDIERQETEREKTGIFTGSYAFNPVNNEQIPIWVADYVLPGYGTGAIMAVPAHDQRDYEFAQKFNLPVVHVVFDRPDVDGEIWYDGEGTMKNSKPYNGLTTAIAREKIVEDLRARNVAVDRVNYKLHDWLISRQRYWGAPIPIIHCPKDGALPVPEDQLPVTLPEIDSYQPSSDGRSPLTRSKKFVQTTCPKCGGKAERETDTMDGFACSSWYFLRFADPHNKKKAFSKDSAKFWLPVDDYIGGAEHAVMHLLYARFWTKVMFDAGLIDFNEPFTSLRNHGMILAPDGQKMSKSKGNTIEPDELISQGYGADSIRLMELFIGPWDQAANWSTEGIGGMFRFLQRVWTLVQEFLESKDVKDGNTETVYVAHRTIKKVSKDLHNMQFNTAIASLMEATNDLYKIKARQGFANKKDWLHTLTTLTQLLAPFAPHIAEELWQDLDGKGSVHTSIWPVHDDRYLARDSLIIVVQVNGKVRGNIEVPVNADQTAIIKAAKNDSKVSGYLSGRTIKKTIYVPGKLISFVI